MGVGHNAKFSCGACAESPSQTCQISPGAHIDHFMAISQDIFIYFSILDMALKMAETSTKIGA
jgi:hypothetical protein